MLYCLNHGFYWYACDKFKRAYFKSVSRKHCVDFINKAASTKDVLVVIANLN